MLQLPAERDEPDEQTRINNQALIDARNNQHLNPFGPSRQNTSSSFSAGGTGLPQGGFPKDSSMSSPAGTTNSQGFNGAIIVGGATTNTFGSLGDRPNPVHGGAARVPQADANPAAAAPGLAFPNIQRPAEEEEKGEEDADEEIEAPPRAAAASGPREGYTWTPPPNLGLELTSEPTEAEIRRAYRKLSVIYHPDKHNQSPDATAAMQAINEVTARMVKIARWRAGKSSSNATTSGNAESAAAGPEAAPPAGRREKKSRWGRRASGGPEFPKPRWWADVEAEVERQRKELEEFRRREAANNSEENLGRRTERELDQKEKQQAELARAKGLFEASRRRLKEEKEQAMAGARTEERERAAQAAAAESALSPSAAAEDDQRVAATVSRAQSSVGSLERSMDTSKLTSLGKHKLGDEVGGPRSRQRIDAGPAQPTQRPTQSGRFSLGPAFTLGQAAGPAGTEASNQTLAAPVERKRQQPAGQESVDERIKLEKHRRTLREQQEAHSAMVARQQEEDRAFREAEEGKQRAHESALKAEADAHDAKMRALQDAIRDAEEAEEKAENGRKHAAEVARRDRERADRLKREEQESKRAAEAAATAKEKADAEAQTRRIARERREEAERKRKEEAKRAAEAAVAAAAANRAAELRKAADAHAAHIEALRKRAAEAAARRLAARVALGGARPAAGPPEPARYRGPLPYRSEGPALVPPSGEYRAPYDRNAPYNFGEPHDFRRGRLQSKRLRQPQSVQYVTLA